MASSKAAVWLALTDASILTGVDQCVCLSPAEMIFLYFYRWCLWSSQLTYVLGLKDRNLVKISRLLPVDTRQKKETKTIKKPPQTWIKFSKETLPCHAHTGKIIGPHAWHPLSFCTIVPFTRLQKTAHWQWWWLSPPYPRLLTTCMTVTSSTDLYGEVLWTTPEVL